MKKLSILLLVALLSFSFVACGDDDDAVGLSFTADPNSVLLVNNTSGEDIVLFSAKDNQTPGKLLGGVPGNAQGHGVPNVSSSDGLFVVNVCTKTEYLANPANPKIGMSTLIYVDTMPATYAVSATLQGDGQLVCYNQSEAYVELRKDSFYGNYITVLRPLEKKTMFVPTGDYDIFPVMKKEMRSGGKIVGLAEQKLMDQVDSYSFGGGNIGTITIPASYGTVEHRSTYIVVENNSTFGLRLNIGDSPQINVLGRQVINAGGKAQFNFDTTGTSTAKAFNFTKTMGDVFSSLASTTFNRGFVYVVTIPLDGGAATVGTGVAYEDAGME